MRLRYCAPWTDTAGPAFERMIETVSQMPAQTSRAAVADITGAAFVGLDALRDFGRAEIPELFNTRVRDVPSRSVPTQH